MNRKTLGRMIRAAGIGRIHGFIICGKLKLSFLTELNYVCQNEKSYWYLQVSSLVYKLVECRLNRYIMMYMG